LPPGAEAHVANDLYLIGRRRRRRCGNCMDLALQQVYVILDHVVPALSRRLQYCNPNHSYHPAGKRQGMEETARAAVLLFRPLARLARAYILGDVDVLPDPEGEATNQQPRLGPPEVPPDRLIVALALPCRVAPEPASPRPLGLTTGLLCPAPADTAGHTAPETRRRAGPARRRGQRCRACRRVCLALPPPLTMGPEKAGPAASTAAEGEPRPRRENGSC
jgi:hypothetical protein